MKGKFERKESLGKRIAKAFLEIFGEVIVMFVFLVVGIGVCLLLGRQDVIVTMDPELLCVIGIVTILICSGVIWAVGRLIRKKRRFSSTGQQKNNT